MTILTNPQEFVEVIEIKAMQDKSKIIDSATIWLSSQWRALLSELIATMLLVIFGCMTCIPIQDFPHLPPMYPPFGFGLAVLLNVQIFGHISGAHMNPAVTLASVIWGGTSIPLGIAYIMFQCFGAILGYGILIAVAPMDIAEEGVCVNIPRSGLTVFQVFGIEFMLTATLCFVCCALWDPVNKDQQDSVPIKFGLTITGLALAGGPLTGASMNPARSLGPVLWAGMWNIHWVYWIGPFLGAAFASATYKYTLLKKI